MKNIKTANNLLHVNSRETFQKHYLNSNELCMALKTYCN